MRTFDEVYQIVEESSHETAFNREEALALYNTLISLSVGSKIVEVGVEFGRSTSVIAEVAKERKFSFTAVDAWVGEYSAQAKAHVESQMNKYGWEFTLLSTSSVEAGKKLKGNLDLVHIDGDHEKEAVLVDCDTWLPRVKANGYALFDDYGHDSLPGVYAAVTEYMEKHYGQWKFVGRYGNKLGIFQRLA